ncbi:MAG: RimK family protein [Rhodospirillales bacterium]|nr:RimK family protein [Rhodospirillales bacterium]
MPLHVIVVDRRSDFPWPAPNRFVTTAKDFVSEGARRLPASARVVNLCGDLGYLSLGYYASLLAEARGHKVIPSVEVVLDLHWKRLLRIALPEANELVRRTFQAPPDAAAPIRATIFFGIPDDGRLTVAARRIFELFRCPLLSVDLKYKNGWTIESIEPISIRDVPADQSPLFAEAFDRYTRTSWRKQKTAVPARWSIAILHDPKEKLPPSSPKALERFVRAGAQLGCDVELITRADYDRLLEFDALFIRETTALDNHTYRFAKKAESEGMPVIDDPRSILTCTNKIYLAELLQAHEVPCPRTLILDRRRIGRIERELGFPAVIKIPDGSFSRGVFKAADAAQLAAIAEQMFKDTDLIIAQEYMETPFDWRVGVLDRKPLYVCQYFMARDHWQIVKHGTAGEEPEAGSCRTLAIDAAPPKVIDIATRAASLIGPGLYGVDLKQTERGVFVVEINDNPNIDTGIEDAVLRDDLYRAVMGELVRRLEQRMRPGKYRAPPFSPVPSENAASHAADGGVDSDASRPASPAASPGTPSAARRSTRSESHAAGEAIPNAGNN